MAETFKYEFDGVGYKNKRTLNNAKAIKCLNSRGLRKLELLEIKASERVQDKMGASEEEAEKMKHIGFRNSQQKKLNQTLDLTVEKLTEKGFVELVIYTHVGGGGVVANARTVLYRKDFSEHGLEIIGDIVVDPPQKTDGALSQMAPQAKPVEGNAELLISDSIDVEDAI